jgi:predicted peptidase
MSIFQKLAKLGDLRYGVYLPPDHNKAENSWPILCYLHGRRECGQTLDTEEEIEDLLTRHGPLKAGNPPIATNDFIVVVPQMPCLADRGERSFNDNWLEYADTVKQIVETVRKEHNGDPLRIHLTGFSYGGNGVFRIASLPEQADFWAKLWPVDPVMKVPESRFQPSVWIFSRNENVPSGYQKVKAKEDDSDGDGAPDGEYLYTHSKTDHPGTASLAYKDKRVYKWLKQHSKVKGIRVTKQSS